VTILVKVKFAKVKRTDQELFLGVIDGVVHIKSSIIHSAKEMVCGHPWRIASDKIDFLTLKQIFCNFIIKLRLFFRFYW
tara:strand:+ start:99 stop:335 length:237 start_codon:yes stop_codon:yes gene_type:complete